MTRALQGAIIASIVYLAAYIWGPQLLGRLLGRNDDHEWHDLPKQPTYRYHGERLHHD